MPPFSLLSAGLLVCLAFPGPFGPGERLRYDARIGLLSVGTAEAAVLAGQGAESLVFRFHAQGGPPGLRVRYALTSRVNTSPFTSREFHRRIEQGGSVEEERFEIVPDSALYRRVGDPRAWVTPADALDELALLYWLRTERLAPGERRTVRRYFKTGWNPVRIVVGERESVVLGDGTEVGCVSVWLAARGMQSEVCLTEDARRVPVRLSIPLSFGRATLRLRSLPAAR